MRCNKQELSNLATQTSQNFDREGVLVLIERQDGFFRRSEECTVKWFRLRGNLLFYLKGPVPWYEPMGLIVLGHHQVKIQTQDENGHWPFQIVWDNGVCYKLASFEESERTLWLKAIQRVSLDVITAKIAALKEKLRSIRPIIEIENYRLQRGIVTDLNEVPLCELAISCDNLLCDGYGRPPSPMAVVFVQYANNLSVKYGSTETIQGLKHNKAKCGCFDTSAYPFGDYRRDVMLCLVSKKAHLVVNGEMLSPTLVFTCSNPSFAKTVLFRSSDGLNGETLIRIVVYDVKEYVSETSVPIGLTVLKLSTIQEAQKLRIALLTRGNKTVGFVTLHSWSLEPLYTGTSPLHTNENNILDIAHKVLCHRRSQSLPPRLGLKLKYPSYGSLLKQNLANSHHVTYRFHSGLGGDITVHEVMAESKMCYQLPMQLLNIYIKREKELLDDLVSVGETCGHWQKKQLELASVHVSLLKHYSHSMRCMEQVDNLYFKASCRKNEAGLEFAPVNLHLHRMWAHNDALNRSGFHDVVTAGAFTAHAHKSERTGGLIRLVQDAKDIHSGRAELCSAAIKIQSEYEAVMALVRLREESVAEIDRIVMLLQAKRSDDSLAIVEEIKSKIQNVISLWETRIESIEESLSAIGWPKNSCNEETDRQTMSSIIRITEQMSLLDAMSTESEPNNASSSSSSKESSPTGDLPTMSSLPILKNNQESGRDDKELHFYPNYFKGDREERSWQHSFRSMKSRPRLNETQSLSFESKSRHGSMRSETTCSASLNQVSYKCMMESGGCDKQKGSDSVGEDSPLVGSRSSATKETNIAYLKSVGSDIETALTSLVDVLTGLVEKEDAMADDDFECIKRHTDNVKFSIGVAEKWLRASHAALRLKLQALGGEGGQGAKGQAALQARRDACDSQALTTVTTGLLAWFCSTPSEVVVRVLTSGLGPLCCFEGLLSLYSSEKAMWGDMVVAIEDLQTVVFQLTKVGHSNSAMPQVTGTRGALTVLIPVSDSLYSKFTSKEHLSFSITAVFFNIGINEKATLAEALGETTPQYHSNSDNLKRIQKYYHKYCKVFPQDHLAASRASSRTKPLDEVIESLKVAVHKKVPKNVEVLQLSELATRLMNGIRFTSCKSAKDRSGMAVTLEQCNILASEYHLGSQESKEALAIMRSEGCRRENTVKNIGIRKYAFSKKQVAALPEDYRPPLGTFGSAHS